MNKIKNLLIPKATSPLDIWLYYLEHLHVKPIDLCLDRVLHVAINLNLLHPAPQIIIVGGTNGKGTTCCLLEAILLEHGMRVGVYSSPHLLRYTERVHIQGKELPETAHSEAMAFVEAGRCGISLSYFEFSTLAAFQLFKQAALDIVILEVGLGGRLDATNIVDADVAVITTIALDHTNWLGTNRASIAQEKAGIFRRGKPVIVGEPNRPTTLDIAVTNIGATLHAYNRDWWWQSDSKQWCWWDKNRELRALPIPSIPLANAATALATIQHLSFAVPEKVIKQGLYDAVLPGRFQLISHAPLTIVDIAHNPHAADYLANRLSSIPQAGKIRAVVGMLADKDISGVLACLKHLVHVWYCASLNGPRAASAAYLATYLDNNAHQFTDVLSAWHQAMKDAAPKDCVLVFGSFYTVAPIIALVKKKKYCYCAI